jgi:hypothetical protein
MVADWSVECSAEDPVLVVPWSASSSTHTAPTMHVPSSTHAAPSTHRSGGEGAGTGASSGGQFIDLRENPYDLDQIPEAELYPPLMQALRALNVPRSPMFTAKCDAWVLDAEEIDELCQELCEELGEELGEDVREDVREPRDRAKRGATHTADRAEPVAGFASYIDLIWRDRTIFASFHQSEQLLHRLTRLAVQLDHPRAMLDCVLRPAMVDLTGPQEGYSITLYVKALGADIEAAQEVWSAALQSVVGLLRSKDIAFA